SKLQPYIDALIKCGEDSDEGEIIDMGEVELCNCHDSLTEKADAKVESKLTKDLLEITTMYYMLRGREQGTQITVKGIENIATLFKHFNVDIADTSNLLFNLTEALAVYGREHGFEDAADYKPLFESLDMPFTLKRI
ncbi:MAG: hypothetical protein NC453_23695, partial [Muribaculum sp.]|nr:hypothetical protein [Muribaculum sp.]